jgi:4-aminobutyrate aminotransferase/(S)-3-amino-2-methylpropionate transaminase
MVLHKIEKEIGASNVACIVIEPILGEGGFIVPCKGFLPGLAKFCKENGIVFIADEVQTGFARTGHMFACEDEAVVPDLIVTAKGIAAGLPLAAVTGRADIMDSIHLSGLGGTYGGNPIACAAALGAIEIIEKEKLAERANKIGKIMRDALNQMAKKYSIGDVRGRGAMQAIELIKPGSKEPNAEAQAAIIKYCISKGVLILSAGTYANVIRLLPPLIIDEALLQDGLAVLDEAIASVTN